MVFNAIRFLAIVAIVEAMFIVARIALAQLGDNPFRINSLLDLVRAHHFRHIVIRPALFGLPTSIATVGVAVITSGTAWMFAAIPTFIVAFFTTTILWWKAEGYRQSAAHTN